MGCGASAGQPSEAAESKAKSDSTANAADAGTKQAAADAGANAVTEPPPPEPAPPPSEPAPPDTLPASAIAAPPPPAEDPPASAPATEPAPAAAAPAEAPPPSEPEAPPAEAPPAEAPPAEAPPAEAPPAEAPPAEAPPAEDLPEEPKETLGAGRVHPAGRVAARAKKINWSMADPDKWTFPEVEFAGSYSYHTAPRIEEVSAVISKGLEDLKSSPETEEGMFFQSNMVEWPEDQQKYNHVARTGSGFQIRPQEGGGFTWVQAKYEALPPEVEVQADAYTDSMNYGGYVLGPPRMPGRGQGCADLPNIRVIDTAHPRDVSQGGVGDCWLLCAMSAVAEYKGVVAKHLFKNTSELADRPHDDFNQYTITLYDLSAEEWQPTDIVVDERLCVKPDGSNLLGASPSITGELWACYLEKAVAAHCGGWDNINGGTCTHAWRLLLGCRHVYTFNRHEGSYGCYGTFNPNDNVWEQLANSPHQGFQGLWPMVWPEVGGGGGLDLKLSRDDFFERLVTWDNANFIMAAGTDAGSDATAKDGIVQGHAYTILQCVCNPGGNGFHLVKVRNPWGEGEFSTGKWTDEGAGWDEYPDVKEALNPKDSDDGVFWMDKDELFEYFPTFYLCAKDMSTLQ